MCLCAPLQRGVVRGAAGRDHVHDRGNGAITTCDDTGVGVTELGRRRAQRVARLQGSGKEALVLLAAEAAAAGIGRNEGAALDSAHVRVARVAAVAHRAAAPHAHMPRAIGRVLGSGGGAPLVRARVREAAWVRIHHIRVDDRVSDAFKLPQHVTLMAPCAPLSARVIF